MTLSARITTVLAVVTALGCGLEGPMAIDDELSLSQTVKLVPFAYTARGTPAAPPDITCPAGELAAANTIEGEGTLLGTFTGENEGCINPITGVLSSNDGTITAANGDVVMVEMDPANPYRFVSVDFSTGEFESTGGSFIVGGTGRFDGATGSFTIKGTGNVFVPGSAVFVAEGMISSVGSIK